MIDRKSKVKSILITQPKPESDKNPYSELVKKYNVKLDFRSFIHVEGISVKEFRKEKINLAEITALVFTSRQAIDHFFRLCEELRFDVPAELKYFCNIESTALYLQKYIQYRKRKIFIGKQNISDLMDQFKKNSSDKYLYPCSNVSNDDTITKMRKLGCSITEAVMYRTVCTELHDVSELSYDMISFFSPFGIKSLFHNFPNYEQKNTRIATFGTSTQKTALDSGLVVDIPAPTAHAPSMIMAIEEYLKIVNK
jgi:uroporphyrinogen-III synthase